MKSITDTVGDLYIVILKKLSQFFNTPEIIIEDIMIEKEPMIVRVKYRILVNQVWKAEMILYDLYKEAFTLFSSIKQLSDRVKG